MKTYTTKTTFLPGCVWSQSESLPPASPPTETGLWVRSSAKQERSTSGEPIGYRHYLMRGKRVVSSGIGADAARMFAAQAEFLNGIGISRTGTPRHCLETAPDKTSFSNAHATMAGPDLSNGKEVPPKIT